MVGHESRRDNWYASVLFAAPCGERSARLATSIPGLLVVAIISTGLLPGLVSSAPSCAPGWTLIAQYDNSFQWERDMYTDAEWRGVVQLWEDLDSGCSVLGIRVTFTDPSSGGTLHLKGSTIGVYYSVQYPQPYPTHPVDDSNPDAYGDAISVSPDGYFEGYYAHVHFDVNSRGADEYFIGVNTPAPVVVTDVRASFTLPLDLVGQTVYAQLHLYPDLCQCVVTAIYIPGSAPPPPPPPPAPGDVWSVYVHAHDDEWQAFESPNTVIDYGAGDRVLFIIVTAGDAGNPATYWQAKEEAHGSSVRFFVGTASQSVGSTSICHYNPTTVCHIIRQWNYGTTVTLFMRLPDGNSDGSGFASTGFESLSKLRDGLIRSVTAVDQSTTYNSWEDLYLTIGAAISTFAPFASTTWVNAPDFDRQRQSFEGLNCNGCADHPDNLAVADAVYAITIGASAPWSRAWFIGYPIGFADSRYPANLDATGYGIKRDLFMAYRDRFKGLTGIDIYSEQPTFWENCFHRNYFRVS